MKPVWYRGARFGADIDTIQCLKQLGYQYDSSVTPNIDWTDKGGPDHRQAPEKRYYISEQDIHIAGNSTIQEVPITIRGKRWGVIGKLLPENWLFYQWLRPTHMTYIEMKHLIKQLKERKELVMMFHSMEIMINKTPYVRMKWMQKYYLWRLEKILLYAVKKGYQV